MIKPITPPNVSYGAAYRRLSEAKKLVKTPRRLHSLKIIDEAWRAKHINHQQVAALCEGVLAFDEAALDVKSTIVEEVNKRKALASNLRGFVNESRHTQIKALNSLFCRVLVEHENGHMTDEAIDEATLEYRMGLNSLVDNNIEPARTFINHFYPES